MTVFIKQRDQEMSDDTVKWFRSKPTLATTLLKIVPKFISLSKMMNSIGITILDTRRLDRLGVQDWRKTHRRHKSPSSLPHIT